MRVRAFIACAFAACAGTAAYWGTLDNGFAWDDHVHIEAAPFVQDARNARVLLTPGFWMRRVEVEGSARPLMLASLLADRALWGSEPSGYHLTNVTLHAACSAVLAWFVWLLLRSAGVAALAGALFAVHPVQSEAVCAISFRADLLAALGGLFALAALRRACESRSRAWAAATAGSFALGLLAKESAVVFPALAVLAEVLFPSGPSAARWRRAAAALIAGVLVAYAAFYLRHGGGYTPELIARGAIPAELTRAATQFDESPSEWRQAMRAPKSRLLTMSGVLGDYARLVVWPRGLQADRSAATVSRWSSPRAWSGWAVLVLALAAAWKTRRALPGVALGLCWFLVALAPVSGVLLLPNLIAERYLYLAVAGAAMAAAAALDAAARRCPRPRPALLAASTFLLASALAATRARVPDWRDDAALFGGPLATDSARVRYNRGLLAQRAGRYDEAEAEYRRALELNPLSVEALVNLAEVERIRGREPQRLALLKRAVVAGPRSSIAYEALGHALGAAGRQQDSIIAYHRAIGADPRRSSAQRSLALAKAREHSYGEAQKAAARAASLEPGSASARYELGRIAQEAGQLDEAIAGFRAATRLDPKHGLAWANLGVCLHQAGRPAEALGPMRTAVALLPRMPDGWRNLGALLDELGRLKEAQTAYETAVGLDPPSAGAWHGFGVVLQKRGLIARAEEAYRQALRYDPDKTESRVNLAELRARAGSSGAQREALETYERAVGSRGSFEKALAAAQRADRNRREAAVSTGGDSKTSACRDLGRIAQDAGRLDEAAAAFRAATRFDPSDGLAWANLGVCLHQANRPQEALAPMRRAVELLPKAADGWRNLGAVLDELGRLEESQTAYETAVRLDPASAAAHHGHGVILQKRGFGSRAEEAYRQALRSEPDKIESLVNLALLRSRDGAHDAALTLLARARALRPDDPMVRAAYDGIARRRAVVNP